MKDMVLKMNEMKEQKVKGVIEKDIDSFYKLVLSIALVEVGNVINELIKLIIEDNFNEKRNRKK